MQDAFAERHAAFHRLRRRSWLVRTLRGKIAIDREHVQTLLADRRLRNPLLEHMEAQGVTDGLLHRRLAHGLQSMQGEDHLRLRTLLRPAFVPSAVDRHRPIMRDLMAGLIAPVRAAGRCDFAAVVAHHYPLVVMCHLLGIPVSDHDRFIAWLEPLSWILSTHLAEHIDEAEWGVTQVDDYVGQLIADRRRTPRDDLVTVLVQAEEEGDRLTDSELRSAIVGLLWGGYDTTRNQLNLTVHLFAHHPDQWALLAARPELVPAAVEEVLRFNGAADAAPRLVTEDFELDGKRFTAGTVLVMSTAAANRDPAATADPDTFDITAEREHQHLTFGGGAHYCLGAWLARAEIQEALTVLAPALPGLALDGEPTWGPPRGLLGPDTLPIRWTAAP